MRSSLKVLFVISSVSWGGLEMNVLNVAYEMSRRSHKITIMCNQNGRLFKEAEGNFNVLGIESVFSKSFFAIYNFLRRNNPDIVHIYKSWDVKVVVPSVLLSKRRPVLIFDPQIGIGVKKRDLFHKFVYKRLDSVLANSRDIASGFLKNLPIDETKVKVVYPGVDVRKFKFTEEGRRKIRQEFELDDRIVIGVISRFSPGKGHEELFHAFKILRGKFNDVKLLVVGEPTVGEIEYFKGLQRLNKELGIADDTIWTGFRKDIPEILSAIDIFVAPSRAEAFGISLIEAMAVGLPVVATRSAGFLDIVEDGVNGLFFEGGNYVELAGKIESLITNKSLAKKLGEGAKETVIKKFSFDRYIDEIESLYFKLLKSKQMEVENV